MSIPVWPWRSETIHKSAMKGTNAPLIVLIISCNKHWFLNLSFTSIDKCMIVGAKANSVTLLEPNHMSQADMSQIYLSQFTWASWIQPNSYEPQLFHHPYMSHIYLSQNHFSCNYLSHTHISHLYIMYGLYTQYKCIGTVHSRVWWLASGCLLCCQPLTTMLYSGGDRIMHYPVHDKIW